MARPLLTEALANAQLDAVFALEDCQARVFRAVADGEMSRTTGRELMAFISRIIENTEAVKRLTEELHKVERVHDIGKRGGFMEPTPHIERVLAEAGLAVINCENVTELHPDEDQVA